MYTVIVNLWLHFCNIYVIISFVNLPELAESVGLILKRKSIVSFVLIFAYLTVLMFSGMDGIVVHAESLGLNALSGKYYTAKAVDYGQIRKVSQLSRKETTAAVSGKINDILFKSAYRPESIGGMDWVKDNHGSGITSVYDPGLETTVSWGWLSWGCFSYACFVSEYSRGTIGSIVGTGMESIPTASEIKAFFKKWADPGEHIRFYYKSQTGSESVHSVAYLASDADGFYFLSESGDGLKVSVLYCTYSYFNSVLRVKSGDYTLKVYDTSSPSIKSGSSPKMAAKADNTQISMTKPALRYTPDTVQYKVAYNRELMKRDGREIMRGSDVQYMQACLSYLGYDVSVDGFYGNQSVSAVKQFQAQYGLNSDGDIGKSTWSAIEKAVADNPVPVKLAITSHPQNITAVSDANVSFKVAAKGTGLKYQWGYMKSGQSSWTSWSGRNTAVASAKADASLNGMKVRCCVTDRYGNKVYSNVAVLTVTKKQSTKTNELKITVQPQSKTITSGESVTVSVRAQGDGLKYQWYFKKKGETKWSIWEGRTHASESVTPNASWNGIQMYCRIKDSTGNVVKSNDIVITVNTPAVRITGQPQSKTISLGESLTVAVKAQGIGLKYQWYFKKKGETNWSVWKGRTHASESVTPNESWNGIQIHCRIKDSYGNVVKSNDVVITVNTPETRITGQPQGKTIVLGESLTVSVKAQGIGLKYQWYFKKKGETSWSVWKGRTHASESVTPNESWNRIQIHCRIKDSSGKVIKTNDVTITVTDK